jgi:Lipid A 3-O-deacylase (PagL)
MKQIIILTFLLISPIYAEGNIYALKAGLLSHSTGAISDGRESGTDLHLELLFNQKFLKAYPALGADINLHGDTSFIYSGLAWEGKFFKSLLLGTSFGIALHNGDLEGGSSENRQLGTRILFRGAVDIGLYLRPDLSMSFMYDHYSNLGLAGQRNQGNDNMGIRLSYYF